MTLKSLGDGLRDLADAVETVDLRDRALATSARLRARRVIATVVGAAAVLVIAVVGVNGVWTHRAAPDPAGPVAERPSGQELLPAPARRPSLEANDLSGTFYYLSPNRVGEGELDGQTLVSWRNGGEPVVLARDIPVTGTESVSPDGRYLSRVDDGNLLIRDIATGEEHPVLPYADDQMCVPPVWAPDGQRLFVRSGDSGTDGFYDISTGKFAEVPDVDGCQVRVYGTDGEDGLAYVSADSDGYLVLRDAADDSDEVGYAGDVQPGMLVDEAYSVSPDGDRACARTVTGPEDATTGDGPRSEVCDTVLALGPDEMGEVALDGMTLAQALMFEYTFVARGIVGGDVAVRLFSDDGELIDEVAEGAVGEDSVLVGYVP